MHVVWSAQTSGYLNRQRTNVLKGLRGFRFDVPSVRLRHHGSSSRYPHLDGVLSKVNKLANSRTATTTSAPLRTSKNRKPVGRNNDDLYETYDDFEYMDRNGDELDKDDDDFMHSESEENEDEQKYGDEFEEEAEDEDERKHHRNWQAEEATDDPTSLTQMKWDRFGTRAKVEESRTNQMNNRQTSSFLGARAKTSEVIDHIRRVNLEAKCSVPRLKVVNIQEERPSPGKTYLPHCTVLHRCSDDTGCCSFAETKCQAKKQTLVYLYFYTSMLGHQGSKVERLAFYNHTECGCQKIGATPTDVSAPPENLRMGRNGGLSVRSASSLFDDGCTCPEEFLPKRRFGSKCTCDCITSNSGCINMKKGREHFSYKDRVCIYNEKCGIPNCEYGPYIHQRGRCPKKQEKLDAYANVTRIQN